MKSVELRIIKTALVNWRELRFIQQEGFKELPAADHNKLKSSLLANNFIEPFKVWHHGEEVYCLDGKHRTLLLEELSTEGVEVPELLPANFIACKDKTEAARLVLIYSSVYAKITEEGLNEFVDYYGLDLVELSETIDLPGIESIVGPIDETNDPFDDPGVPAKNQYGVIAMCESEAEQERVFNELTNQGYKCKVVVT